MKKKNHPTYKKHLALCEDFLGIDLAAVLEVADWNLTRAAEMYGVSVNGMRRMLKRHRGLDKERKRKGPKQ